MKDVLIYFYQTVLDFDLILRFAFSAGLLYGSVTVALFLSSLPIRMVRKCPQAQTLERFFFIGFLAVFMLLHLLPAGEVTQSLLIALFFIVCFTLFIYHEQQRQCKVIKEGFNSFAVSEKKLDNLLRNSFVRRNFLSLISKYHYRFWLMLLIYEVVSENIPGIGGAIRLALREWNTLHTAFVFLFIILILVLFDAVLHLSESSITPWRENHENQ